MRRWPWPLICPRHDWKVSGGGGTSLALPQLSIWLSNLHVGHIMAKVRIQMLQKGEEEDGTLAAPAREWECATPKGQRCSQYLGTRHVPASHLQYLIPRRS